MRAKEMLNTCHRLSCRKASEVLVFLVGDLDRMYKAEVPHAFPVAYALKGYSMKSESMRHMIQDVLDELFAQGLYTPVVSYDGQWASLSVRDENGKPLTLLELQRNIYNDAKQMKKSEITEKFFKSAQVKVKTLQELKENTDYQYDNESKSVIIGTKRDTHLYQPSDHISLLIQNTKDTKKKRTSEADNEKENDFDYVFSSLQANVIESLSNEDIAVLNIVNNTVDTNCLRDTLHDHVQIELGDTIIGTLDVNETEVNVSEIIDSHDEEMVDSTQVEEDTTNLQSAADDTPTRIMKPAYILTMLHCLHEDKRARNKWLYVDIDSFKSIFCDTSTIMNSLSRDEMKICLDSVKPVLDDFNLKFAKSWNKSKLSELLMLIFTKNPCELMPEITIKRKRKTPDKLVTLCKRAVNKLPKVVMNAVIAEDVMSEHVQCWRETSPFAPVTKLGEQMISWFSCPEYNTKTLAYLFSFLDVHHLITNCRIKVCKDGIPERGISKKAWEYVARSDLTNLKVAHVVDLLDKQSDAIARETFSKDVEHIMSKQYPNEAHLCKLIRQFYEAEDDPGLSAEERTERRLELREWLLEGVNFCKFPPYGKFIRGIPNVMFQGFLTNIERRVQLFPYIKCGSYNVRALGSLEAENLFGQFQDLDPKGLGVIKAEEVPQAIETACQLLRTRMQPDRPFHMTLSKQKVYPVKKLLAESETVYSPIFLYPEQVHAIVLKNHMFDMKTRSKRKAQRKLVSISGPDDAARGARGVRQHFREDHSKLLADRRANIELEK